MKRSRAKSREDIMTLMHVIYTAEDALPLQRDTDMMSAQDIWLRKYHELWGKLEENTKSSFCTALWKWLAWCDNKTFDIIHLEQSKWPEKHFPRSGTSTRCASFLWKQFSKETLIKSASSKAFAATTEARIGPHTDPLRDGFQATSLDSDEVVRILDACIRHQDHFNGFKVAAMVLLGTSMGFRGDDVMDAKPSLLAVTPVVRCVPVPMQVITWRTCRNICGWTRKASFGDC
ncbi:hypothetical protein WJX82_000104 [Trebouxia sp. C0006]